MTRWMTLGAAMLLCGIAFTHLGFAQRSGATESKFLTIGDVSKIDVKNKSITIKDATLYNMTQLGNARGDSSTPAGRDGGGGAVRGGGRGGRRRGGSGAAPSVPRGASAPIPTEYKVTVSSKTLIKAGDNEIKLDDLKVGD